MKKELSVSAASDLMLVAECIQGSDKAYSALYKKYFTALEFLFLKSVRDADLAQDLAIETIAKAFERIRKYDSTKGVFSTWLYKIANNHLIDHCRTLNLNKKTFSLSEFLCDDEGHESPLELVSTCANPEQILIKKERHSQVNSMLDKIVRPSHKEIAKLRYLDELSYDEIASILNTPVGTVKGILFRVRKNIEVQIKESCFEVH